MPAPISHTNLASDVRQHIDSKLRLKKFVQYCSHIGMGQVVTTIRHYVNWDTNQLTELGDIVWV